MAPALFMARRKMQITSFSPVRWRNFLRVLLANYLGVVGAPPPLHSSLQLCLASQVVLDASFGSFLWRILGPFGYAKTN
jgi:hypothetical protein